MYSKAKLGTHPIHPMLVGFPMTFYPLTLIAFVVYLTASPEIFWFKLAYFSNMAAVATAIITALPGIIDWLFGIPNHTNAKQRGLVHMILNLITLGLFSVNAYFIRDSWNTGNINLGTAITLTAIGSLFLIFAGYYGWEMIGRHKVGVDMTQEQERLQENYERAKPPVYH